VASGKARKRRQQTACGPLFWQLPVAKRVRSGGTRRLDEIHQHITENPLAAMRPGEGMSVGAVSDRD
jgi:hypothetical protein